MSKANVDSSKNILLLKNPQFLPNHSKTMLKYSTNVYPILAKFRDDWVKIVDFLIKEYFCLSLHWPHSQCNMYYLTKFSTQNNRTVLKFSLNLQKGRFAPFLLELTALDQYSQF